MDVFCGIDWAEDHHDIALADRDGQLLARRRIGDDAAVLAGVLRTDLHAHRPLPADSELAQAIAVLARAQQDAVWDRTAASNRDSSASSSATAARALCGRWSGFFANNR